MRASGRLLLHHGARRSSTRSQRACWTSSASSGSCPRARSGAGRSRSATSTSSRRPSSRSEVVETFVNLPSVEAVIGRGSAQGRGSARRARPAGRPDAHAPERGAARTSSTSRARRSTTSGSARWRATRAGACPSTASPKLGEDGEIVTGAERRAADVRDRGGGVRVPRAAVHRARAARGRGRDRGGARRHACRRSSPRPTSRATSTPTRTGPTARSRSRSWPSSRGAAATPTRS